MISIILCPISVEFHGFRFAGPAILLVPGFVAISYFFISTLVWLYRISENRGKKYCIFSRGRAVDSLGAPFAAPPKDEKSLLRYQLEEILKQELDLQKERDEIQRNIEDLPKQYEERQLKRQEIIRERAKATATFYGFWQPDRKTRSAARSSNRMTRPEHRIARKQLLLLCVILMAILLLLWKSLR